jgi:Carbohydrate esterase, sialic acid-specific acetylesterase
MKALITLMLCACLFTAALATERVYVIAGDENAGRYTTAQLGTADSVKCWNYYTRAFENTVNPTRQFYGRTGGVIVQLAEALQNKYPNDTLYFIQYHRPDTDLGYQWKASSGLLFKQLLTEISAALAAVGDYNQLNFIWIQGNKDARNSTYASAYQVNEDKVFDSLRSLYTFNKIIDMNLPTKNPYQYKATVRTAKAANVGGPVVLINSDNFRYIYDQVHLTPTHGLKNLSDAIVALL